MPPIALIALLLAGAPQPAHASECTVGGVRSTAEDVALARTACESARARFAALFGDPVPEVRVILRDRPGYRVGTQDGRAAIVWPTSRAMAAQAGGGEAAGRHVAAQWREVLPHETAHALMSARFYPDHTGGEAAGYGTPLPDWLDEAVAIWAEPEASRALRLAQARALPAVKRDLRAILESPHPAMANRAALAMRDGAPPPADEALRAFYPQSVAVLGFVHEAGGAAAVAELVRRLTSDPATPVAIAGLPGLPEDFDGVVAAWDAWIGGRGAAGAASP